MQEAVELCVLADPEREETMQLQAMMGYMHMQHEHEQPQNELKEPPLCEAENEWFRSQVSAFIYIICCRRKHLYLYI